jgi:hypothetical protein
MSEGSAASTLIALMRFSLAKVAVQDVATAGSRGQACCLKRSWRLSNITCLL